MMLSTDMAESMKEPLTLQNEESLNQAAADPQGFPMDISLGLQFEPLRRLEKKPRQFDAQGDAGTLPPEEDEIMDALAEEYGHRAQFRLNFMLLGGFLVFLSIYFSMLYSQLANSQAYKVNVATQNVLPSTFNSSGVQVFGQFSDIYYWLTNSLLADIWNEPACGNGPCEAPIEIPGGIFPDRGCVSDCGSVQNVTVHVTLLGNTARNYSATRITDQPSWELKMCSFKRRGDAQPDISNIKTSSCLSSNPPVDLTAAKPKVINHGQMVQFDLNFTLTADHSVEWTFYVPQPGGDYILNLTISELIVRLFGGPSGDYYINNSFDTWWISSGGWAINSGHKLGLPNSTPRDARGIRCPPGTSVTTDLCSDSWNWTTGDLPQQYMPCCKGNLNEVSIFPTVNPSRVYSNLVSTTPRTLGGSNKQSNRVMMGVLLHLTRRPYDRSQCGDFTNNYNLSTGMSDRTYPVRFGSLSPWCTHQKLTPTNPYGEDPYFIKGSSLFKSSDWTQYYSPSETLEGQPYAFFNTTHTFHSQNHAGSRAFFVLLDINLNSTQVNEWIQFLNEAGFLDMNSHLLTVRVLIYNGIYKLFSKFKMEILMDDSGSISYQYSLDALSVAEATATKVLFWLFVIGLAVLLVWEGVTMAEAAMAGWNRLLRTLQQRILHILTNMMFITCIILWRLIQRKIKAFTPEPRYDVYKRLHSWQIPKLELTPAPPGGGPSQADLMHLQFEKFEDINQLKKYYVFIGSVNTVLVLWRTLQLSHFHPRLGILTRTLVNIVPDIMAYFFVWAVVTFGYAVMGMITFGDQLTEFHSFSEALNSMLSLYLGTIDINKQLMSIATTVWDQIPSRIFFWTYMIIANLVLLNFLIAIVIDMFSDVKHKNVIREHLVNRMSSESAFTLGSWKYTKAAYYFRLLVSDYEERKQKFYLGRYKRFLASPTYLLGQLISRLRFATAIWPGSAARNSDSEEEMEAGDAVGVAAGNMSSNLLMRDLQYNDKELGESDNNNCDTPIYPGPQSKRKLDRKRTRNFRNYKFKALIVDGVEVQNSALADIFAARLEKVKGKPYQKDDSEIRWLVSYVLACYGGESKYQKGFYEEELDSAAESNNQLGSLAKELKSEISNAISKETEDMAAMLSTLQSNIKNNMATLQEQLDVIAEDVYEVTYSNNSSQLFSNNMQGGSRPPLARTRSAITTTMLDAVVHSTEPVNPRTGSASVQNSPPGQLFPDGPQQFFTQPVGSRAAALQIARRARLQRLVTMMGSRDQTGGVAPRPAGQSALPPGFAAQPATWSLSEEPPAIGSDDSVE